MSLIHWWPLNGDLKDQGLSPSTLTINNAPATQYVAGKIGQGYNLVSSSWGSVANITTTNTYSVCAWGKTSSNRNMLFGFQCTGASNLNIYNGNASICLNTGDGDNNPFVSDNDTNVPIINDGIWHHWCIVFKGTEKAKLYIDGEYKGTAKTYKNPTMTNQLFTIGTWNQSGHGYYWNGTINDVRIYDHALSKKEVKEISKGLILHYNFEDPYVEGTTNIRPWSSTIKSTTNTSWDTTKNDGSTAYYRDGYNTGYNGGVPSPSTGYHAHWVYLDNELVMKFPNKNSEVGQAGRWMGITGGITLPWAAGDKYTISWEQRTDNLNLRPWGGIYYKTTSSSSTAFHDGCPSLGTNTNINVWERFSYTFTVNSAYDRTNTSGTLFIYGYGSNNEGTCYVRNVQIEYKDHATPFAPTSRVQDVISDNSGYNNSGTINGACKLITPSNSGNYCMLFENGVTDYLSNSTFIWPRDKITISFWWKSNNTAPTGNYHIPIASAGNGGYYEISIPTNGQIRGGFYINGTRYIDNGTSTKLLNGNWHLCTMTYDGTIIKRYVDAVQEKSTSVTGTLSGATGFTFGHYGNDLTYAIKNGYISDIKIYATALSESDIKAEYNRKASIDRNGNLFTGEVIEENTNVSTTRKNQVKTYSFKEGSNTAKFFGGYTLLEYINMPGPAAGATSQHNTIPVLNVSYNEIDAEVLRVGKGTSGAILISGHYGSSGQWYVNFAASTMLVSVSPSSLGSGTITPTNLPENTWKRVLLKFSTIPSKLRLATWTDDINYWTAQQSCYRYIKCYNDGELVLHLVPAKRNKDNVLGLYDLVEHKFYINQGTGTFTGGTELGPLSAIAINEIKEI